MLKILLLACPLFGVTSPDRDLVFNAEKITTFDVRELNASCGGLTCNNAVMQSTVYLDQGQAMTFDLTEKTDANSVEGKAKRKEAGEYFKREFRKAWLKCLM